MKWDSFIIGLDENNNLIDYTNPRFCDKVWMLYIKSENALRELQRRFIEENYDTFGLEEFGVIYTWNNNEDIWCKARPIIDSYEDELARLREGYDKIFYGVIDKR